METTDATMTSEIAETDDGGGAIREAIERVRGMTAELFPVGTLVMGDGFRGRVLEILEPSLRLTGGATIAIARVRGATACTEELRRVLIQLEEEKREHAEIMAQAQPLRCQCGQMINVGGRLCPLPLGKPCEYLRRS